MPTPPATPPTTVAAYLKALPDDRRKALKAIRKVIRANLDSGYKEVIQYNMIGYCVPHAVYPPGYHCDPKQPLPFAGLASMKNHMALHLFCIYTDPKIADWFATAWKATGRKLDMGKSCVRFKTLDDVPLQVVGDLIARIPAVKFIKSYESALAAPRPARKKTAKKTTKKAGTRTTKKSGTRKSV